MRQVNRILAMLLALLTVCTLLPSPVPAQAAEKNSYAQRAETIRCGANLNWEVDGAGVLTVSGSGPMNSYTDQAPAPWLIEGAARIVKVVVEEGVTSIGDYAFFGCSNLTQVELPSSLTSIGAWAFGGCVRLHQAEIPGSVTFIGASALGYQTGGESYPGLTIVGEAKSQAQSYAAAHSHITFRALEPETALSSPRVTAASLGKDFVTVRWASAGSGVTYRVYYRKGSGAWVSAGSTKELSMQVSRLDSGSSYTFAVVCLNRSGQPFAEPNALLGKTVTYLSAPVLSGVTVVNGGVQVKWSRVNGAAKYRVFYRLPKGKWVKAGDTAGNYLKVGKLVKGNTYSFTVRCLSANRRSFTSSYDTVGLSLPYLATPQIISAVNVDGGVQVKWGRVAGAAKYRLFYAAGSGRWKPAGDTTGTAMVVRGLSGNTTYRFTVRCLSGDGKSYTSYFNTAGVSRTYFSFPVLTKVSSVEDGVLVRWSKTAGVSRYRVFYRQGAGAWKRAGDTSATYFTVGGLTSGSTYSFTVRGINSSATAFTTGYNAKGLSITYIRQPELLEAVNTGNQFTVRWEDSPGAARYRVFYKNSAGKWSKLGDTDDTVFQTAALSADHAQTFTVRCLSANGRAYTSSYDTVGVTARPAGAPLEYNFTGAYASGRYYTSLMSLRLTGNLRDDIVTVAMSQVGYHEGDRGSKDTSGNGYGNDMDNYTEFGRWYYNHVDSGDAFYLGAWCSMFVSWCANEAGISTGIVPRRALVAYMADAFGSMGRYYTWNETACGFGSKTIRKGDFVIYSGTPGGRLSHIGIVTNVEYNYNGNSSRCVISTVEGNVNDQCRTRRWIMTKSGNGYIDSDHVIRGFCCPNY